MKLKTQERLGGKGNRLPSTGWLLERVTVPTGKASWAVRQEDEPALYPPAAVTTLLLLLHELDGVGGRRSSTHAAHHLDAVLRQGWQPQLLPLPHLHCLQGFKSTQCELGTNKRGEKAGSRHPTRTARLFWASRGAAV